MARKKQRFIHDSAPSKGRTNTTAGGTVPPTPSASIPQKTLAPSHFKRAATSARSSPLYEGQIFQMLTDMKEQMKEQQAQSDHNWMQAALARDNAA